MNTLQNFLATSIPQATTDLETALMSLPEEKRNWSAGGTARTAIDMLAEVAVVNGDAAEMIETRKGLENFDLEGLERQKAELRDDWSKLKSLLDQNTSRVVAAIRTVPDEDLQQEIPMPWGPMTLTQIMDYPYWNARYHEGQINFIASMLGCLK
jgi:uncharacterized damage-inducible protein DinB